MDAIKISIAPTIKDAPTYMPSHYKSATLIEAVVVRAGTVEGKSTVDLVFQDQKGNKFVAMNTGRIIRSIANVIGDEG